MQENSPENKLTRIFPWLLVVLAICAIIFYFLVYLGFNALNKKKVEKVVVSPFAHMVISGKSAIVYDVLKQQVIYEKNADEPRPLASLTKVMTAVTAESLNENQNVTITNSDLESEGDSGLRADSVWKLGNLIDYSLIVSSNDGVSAIASAMGAKVAFIEKMNTLGTSIGLLNSKFINEHGLDTDADHVGAYGSARDMAMLFQYVMRNYPNLLEATKYESLTIGDESGDEYLAKNTNATVNSIPSIIASKTGFTDLAGGNLVIAFDAGIERPFIIAVLGSTEEGRFTDTLKLASTTIKYLNDN